MRILKLTFTLITLVFCLAFSSYEKGDDGKPEVDKYVELLKSNHFLDDSIYGWNTKYGGLRALPEFTFKDIDKLLKYRNDTTIITNIPRNTMSSQLFLWHKYEVRMIILWTIESIRAVAVDSSVVKNGRFPSLNPWVTYRVPPKDFNLDYESVRQNPREYYEKWWRENKDKDWQTVSDAYYTWWTENKDKDFNETMIIDPLEHTNFRW